jgi:hypothetical protein
LSLPNLNLDEVLEKTAALIPPAWQFPEVTAACIVLDGQSTRTENFRETSWMQTGKIMVNGASVGQVQVCYLEERPVHWEGPFLMQERKLIDAIAVLLGHVVEQIRAKKALQESEEFAKRVVESSKDCIKILDLEGNLLLISEGGQKLLEIDDATPYLNMSWVNMWHDTDKEAARAAVLISRLLRNIERHAEMVGGYRYSDQKPSG